MKMWDFSERKCETWIPVIWRTLKYFVTFLPQSSLASTLAAQPKCYKAKARTGRMKNSPLYNKIRFNTSKQTEHGPVHGTWWGVPTGPRKLTDEVAKPLSIVFDNSWQPSEVPSDWRKGNITPLFKKGKKTRETTCQSVSQLCPARYSRKLC